MMGTINYNAAENNFLEEVFPSTSIFSLIEYLDLDTMVGCFLLELATVLLGVVHDLNMVEV